MLQPGPIFALLLALVAFRLAVWLHRRWQQRKRADELSEAQAAREDVLKHLSKLEAAGRQPTIASIAGILHATPDEVAALLARMEQDGLLTFAGGALRLTNAGRQIGVHVVRAHRLWETHLAEHTGMDRREWHAAAEDREHALSPAEADALAARLGHPVLDPHGDEIPAAGGRLAPDRGAPLTALPFGQPARVIHLEDEPAVVHHELIDLGFQLGSHVEVMSRDDRAMLCRLDGRLVRLAPTQAQHVDVDPEDDGRHLTLCDLNPDETGTVLGLGPECRGIDRQRLLDLGFVPDSRITRVFTSPTGGTVAYRIRDTLVALRHDQARHIRVRRSVPVSNDEHRADLCRA